MNISHLSKAQVLAALYNGSKPLGLGVIHFDPRPMTEAEAEEILKNKTSFDYLKGRVMKIDLKGDELETWLYNRDIGEGAAELILSKLTPQPAKEGLSFKKDTPDSTSVKRIEYDAETKVLTLVFKYGTYDYKAVPADIAFQAKNAPSIGSFVHSDLKDKFETVKRP